MKFHPLSECLPILPGHELNQLTDDIRKNGLLKPITLFEKMILDGRNRYLACKKAKVKTRFEDYAGDDPVGFVVSNNIARRHLPANKRAEYAITIFAAGEAWANVGRPKADAETPTEGDIAIAAGVSRSTVQRAKNKAKRKAAPQAKGQKIASFEAIFDTLGYPIPEPALPYWNRAGEVKEALKAFQKLKLWADDLHRRRDPLYCEVNLSFIRAELNNMHQNLEGALPYVVCTLCDGLKPDDCVLCHGRGVISEFRWKHALPKEDREKREQQIAQLSQPNAA